MPTFGLDALLDGAAPAKESKPDRSTRQAGYRESLDAAHAWLDRLPPAESLRPVIFEGEAGELQYFTVLQENLPPGTAYTVADESRLRSAV